MSPRSLDIIVAGGGIAGLSSAIALRQAGHKVTVLEKSSFANEVGAAVTIPPNATRVLRAWGMDFDKAGMIRYEGMEVKSADSNDMHRIAYRNHSGGDKYGSPYLLSHRVDLHEALRDLAVREEGGGLPVQILNQHKVTGFDAQMGVVQLENSELQADVVVAADGVHSLASQHTGTLKPSKPSETTVVRFLIPTSVLKGDPVTDPLVAGDGVCSIYRAAKKDRWLVRYPCRRNTLQNFAFYFDGCHDYAEDARSRTRQDLVRDLQGFHPSLVAACVKAMEVLPLWRCAYRDPLQHSCYGKLVIVGDAAHAMLPQLGQGAAQAIEDAGALGILLGGLEDNETVEERLKLFDALRKDRVAEIQILSEVPVGEGSFDQVREKYRDYFPTRPLPGTREELTDRCSTYDVLKESSKILTEHSMA